MERVENCEVGVGGPSLVVGVEVGQERVKYKGGTFHVQYACIRTWQLATRDIHV